MKHYIDSKNQVFAFAENGSQEHLIKSDMKPISGAELAERNKPTPEQLADTARTERDRLIESVRWRIERHSDELALGSEPTEPLEPLLQHIQILRDVPQQSGFPESVEWPQCP